MMVLIRAHLCLLKLLYIVQVALVKTKSKCRGFLVIFHCNFNIATYCYMFFNKIKYPEYILMPLFFILLLIHLGAMMYIIM